MKEVKEVALDDKVYSQTLSLPWNVHFVSAYYLNGIKLAYEQLEEGPTNPDSEYTFLLIAPFDKVPHHARFLGTVPFDDSVYHVYQED